MTKASLLLLALTTPLAAEVTFNEHIAPLVHENCTGCHRPNQSGPFSLITYRDVKKRSGTIEEVLLDRYMPPWKPVNTNMHFANDRRLDDEEIALFSKWVEADCPEGPADRKPTPSEYPSGWYLGEPDLVVTMNGKFEVPAEGRDIYRSFVFPLQLPEDKWVKAVELRPRARSVVHHALFFVDSFGDARRRDGRDGQPGIRGMDFRPRPRPGAGLSSASFDGSDGLGGYVPGATPATLPGDLAMFLPKGSDVVMQTHFHPSGKKEVEQAELALYFADKAPERNLVAIQVPPAFGATKMVNAPIRPGDKNHVVEDSYTFPVAVEAIQVHGHAHYICREMKMTATLPDGKESVLLEIADWDLDWQDSYQFKKPLRLPAGTVLKTRLVYDNSAANPENPFNPPQAIQWGPESDDEMGSITLVVVPVEKKDAQLLTDSQSAQLIMSGLERFPGGVEIARATVFNAAFYDRNRDGVLQFEEVPDLSRDDIFARFDMDGDKSISAEERPALQAYLDFLTGKE